MPIWQIKIQKVIIWCTLARRLVQTKIDKIFKKLPNVFGIANGILVVGYEANGKDHNETLQRVVQICRQVNLKLNKDKCHYRCTSVPFLVKSYPDIERNQIHRS